MPKDYQPAAATEGRYASAFFAGFLSEVAIGVGLLLTLLMSVLMAAALALPLVPAAWRSPVTAVVCEMLLACVLIASPVVWASGYCRLRTAAAALAVIQSM